MKHNTHFPPDSLLTEGFGKFDYVDCFAVEYEGTASIDTIVTRMFSMPSWGDVLMSIRDKAVGIFGLKTDNKALHQMAEYYEIGQRAVMFTVIARNENELVMAEDDMHLNFRTSMLKDGKYIYSMTAVKYNNFFGKFYFFFVKPFHALIIRSGLKKLQKSLENDN